MNVVLYCHTHPQYVGWLHVAYQYITSIFQQSQEPLLADLFSCSPTAYWGREGLLIAAFYTLQMQLLSHRCR
jgi:hypothetical protein